MGVNVSEKNRVIVRGSGFSGEGSLNIYLENGSHYITGSDYIFYAAVTSEDEVAVVIED